MKTCSPGRVHDVAPTYGLACVPAPEPPVQTGNSFAADGEKTSGDESRSPDGSAPAPPATTSWIAGASWMLEIVTVSPNESEFVSLKLHSSGWPTAVFAEHTLSGVTPWNCAAPAPTTNMSSAASPTSDTAPPTRPRLGSLDICRIRFLPSP